jgi:hypothetical protein
MATLEKVPTPTVVPLPFNEDKQPFQEQHSVGFVGFTFFAFVMAALVWIISVNSINALRAGQIMQRIRMVK